MNEVREYRLPKDNLWRARHEVEKVNKRAAKLGQVGFTLDVLREETVESKSEMTGVTTYREYVHVALSGEKVVVDGYTFLATIEHDAEYGNLVLTAPGVEASMVDYRNVTANCDHCGLNRRRNHTFLLEGADGERKQVGRQCLADYFGHDASQALSMLTMWRVLDDGFGDEDGWDLGGGGRARYATDDYLANVCAVMREHGYVSRSNAGFGNGQATADLAMFNMTAKREQDKIATVTAEDEERGRAAREWILSEDHGADGDDFTYNLWRTAMPDLLVDKGQGYVAYLPVAHARFEQREIERAKAKATSDFVGEVGKRLDLTLTVSNVHEHDGHYGVSYITTLLDGDGNRLTWFGSYALEQGATYTGKWTVKKHDDDATYGKRTVVNRPAKLEKLTEVAA